jgi:carbon storage regulator
VLVLARKLHQSILIGDTIRITVLEVRDGQVRLGIDAPESVPVWREEVMREVVACNRAAVSASGTVTSECVAAFFRRGRGLDGSEQ